MNKQYKCKNTYAYSINLYYIIFGVLLTGAVFSVSALIYYSLIRSAKHGAAPASVQLVTAAFLLLSFICIILYRKHVNLEYCRFKNSLAAACEELTKKETALKESEETYNKLYSEYLGKAELFINLTHEMKTPLSVILGAIALLENSSPDNQASDHKIARNFSLMKQNCYRLLRLANNILDISRLESGYMKSNQVNCNIVNLVEEITQSISPASDQKGLTVKFDTDIDEIITAVDVEKMERILLNLLSNAIKFTNSGGKILVNVRKRNETVTISVKDTGPGIPESMQSKIFERYRQVNSSLTEKSEGAGIGLAIAKAFIELQGGRISVSSEEGQGSTFIVELPHKLCRDEKTYKSSNAFFEEIIDTAKIELSDIFTVA